MTYSCDLSIASVNACFFSFAPFRSKYSTISACPNTQANVNGVYDKYK